MAGKRTRVVVGTSSGMKELFSVIENSKGELSIIFRNTHPLDAITTRTSDRMSIHKSPHASDAGFLIKRTVTLSDGQEECSYLYVRPNGPLKMVPVLASLPGLLDDDYKFTAKANEAEVVVYENAYLHEDKYFGSLFYIIIVSRGGLSKFDVEKLNLNLKITEIKFKLGSLFVISGIFHSPAFKQSISFFLWTAPRVLNGIPDIWDMPADVPQPISPDIEHLPYLIDSQIGHLAEAAKGVLLTAKTMWGTDIREDQRLRMMFGFDFYSPDPRSPIKVNRTELHAYHIANPPKGLWIAPKGLEVRAYRGEPQTSEEEDEK